MYKAIIPKYSANVLAFVRFYRALPLLFFTTFSQCTEAFSKEIFIFSLNDFHGFLEESSGNPGVAKFAAALREEKHKLHATSQNSILVAVGDLYQGQYLSSITRGDATSFFLKQLGVKFSAVGSHEFDWDRSRFRKWQQDGGFEFLSSNVFDKNGRRLFTPYRIVNIDGARVGFVGFTTLETQYTAVKSAENDSLMLKPAHVIANEIVDEVRRKGADFIIALSHLDAHYHKNGNIIGHEAFPLSKIKGIDAILAGHGHHNVVGYLNGKAVVQACCCSQCFGVLRIDAAKRRVIPQVVDIRACASKISADREMLVALKRISAKYEDKMANQYIVHLKQDLSQNDILNLIARGIYHYTALNTEPTSIAKMVKRTDNTTPRSEDVVFTSDGANMNNSPSLLARFSEKYAQKLDFIIINGGFVRNGLVRGNISPKSLHEVVPFLNTVVFLDLDGVTLHEAIKHTLSMNGRKKGAFYGDDRNIDPKKVYRVAVSNFMYSKGDKYQLEKAANVVKTDVGISELFIEFFKRSSYVSEVTCNNIAKTRKR